MKRLFFILSVILLSSCTASKIAKWNKQLIKTDEEFSNLSKEKGMKYSFLHYMDSSVVLLQRNSYPIEGKHAFELLQKVNDSSFQLIWKPLFAQSSCKLGYTYGTYTRITKNSTEEGTYVTIWKRQKDGTWKFVLDTGNEGLGKK